MRRPTVLGGVGVIFAAALGRQLPSLTAGESDVIKAWLACYDCEIELDSVRGLAVRRPGATVKALREALLLGPPRPDSTQADNALATTFARDSLDRFRRQLRPREYSRTQYVARAMWRYCNGYRARGAVGLGWIHTRQAVAALDGALTANLDPSVLEVVRFARDSLPPRQGVGRPSPP